MGFHSVPVHVIWIPVTNIFRPLQVLAMSSRSWLSYYYQNRFHLTPLSYESLEYAAGFSSEQCPEGIVAISTNTLRILALEKLGAVFNQVWWAIKNPLQYLLYSCLLSWSNVILSTSHIVHKFCFFVICSFKLCILRWAFEMFIMYFSLLTLVPKCKEIH